MVYSTIFADTHPEAFFISGGSCEDIENIEKTSGEIIKTLLQNTRVIKVVDRDNRSEQEIAELNANNIKVLRERNLESYLLDNSVIKKLCETVGKAEEYENCIKDKENALKASIERGNAPDDYKSARGEIFNSIKKHLQLTKCGNSADAFIRDTLAPLVSSDMEIYRKLDAEIFGE